MNGPVSMEHGRFGRRAVLHSTWCREYVSLFREQRVVELELNMAKGWRGEELEFLRDIPDLQCLEVLDLRIRDVSQIHCLSKLRRLQVTTYCNTAIEFSSFPELISCSLEWRTGASSLFECKSITELAVNRYDAADSALFGQLVHLESLAILNAPLGDVRGLGALASLTSLRLANLKRLSTLDGLRTLQSLEELDINSCRAFTSIGALAFLYRLKRLRLNNCGHIASLSPINALRDLEEVLFYESTNIVDGDLAPLVRQHNLARVSFQNRRHYTHRREDFGAAYSS